MRFLIWGGTGWIGNMICLRLKEQGEEVILATTRTTDLIGMGAELDRVQPDRVLNVAGITGRPTVDWCEDHPQETYLVNTIGTVNLAHACWERHLHVTYYGTGCIYRYDPTHPAPFSELDPPNFVGSVYSHSKVLAEEMLKQYDNVLTLRIRLPISADLHPKNIITKLSRYPKITSIPNSFTVLPELLPISIQMSIEKLVGIVNLVNPGTIDHDTILKLYREYIDPTHTWTSFTEAEQNAILKSPRSNCELSTEKLTMYRSVTPISEAIPKIFQLIAAQNQT